jgi:hypothetical protein
MLLPQGKFSMGIFFLGLSHGKNPTRDALHSQKGCHWGVDVVAHEESLNFILF